MSQNPETPSAVPDVKEEEKWEVRHENMIYRVGDGEFVGLISIPESRERVIRMHNAALEKKEAVAESVADLDSLLSEAYGRGVSAGKQEALQYTPEEREKYGRWVAQSDLREPRAVIGLRDVQGPMEPLPCPFCGIVPTFTTRAWGHKFAIQLINNGPYYGKNGRLLNTKFKCTFGCLLNEVSVMGDIDNDSSKTEADITREAIARWNKRAAPSVPEGPKSSNA